MKLELSLRVTLQLHSKPKPEVEQIRERAQRA